ncbi:flippase [Fusobacterium watanabei]|uniref:flippase n=1 Tax=Fusobacterium TaxID=848 RepID=UPI0030D47CD5
MKTKTVKLNFILNFLRMTIGSLFIVLTTPYITRILGPESLGKVEYVNSIITYFTFFSVLGIPNYGLREVARLRDDKEKLSKLIIELSIIIFLITTITYSILIFFIFYGKVLIQLKKIAFILSANLIFINIGYEWFYKGIEDQLYITKRFLFIRAISFILLFIIIKGKNDYLGYAFIIVLIESGSNILNFINLKKYITLKKINLKELEIIKHLKPIFIIFFATIATKVYSELDSVMIGNISKRAVGIYTIPNKLIKLILTAVTALGSILLPRISNCLEKKDYSNANMYINYSLNYIFFISLPISVFLFLLADNIIYIFAGSQFYDSVIVMKIFSIIPILIGVSYFLGFQLLYPLNLEKYYTYSTVLAAIINFIFNYFMIPKYLEKGAALGTIMAEAIAMGMLILLSRKYLKKINFFSFQRVKYFLASIIMGVIIILIKKIHLKIIDELLLSVFGGGFIYFLSLFLMRESYLMEACKFVKKITIKIFN